MILTILFTILHILVCLFLILVVLAQQGKGQDLASAFGGAGSQTAFGARGTATLLSKITAGAAVVFMITSLTLSYLRPAVTERTVVPEATPATETETPTPPATEPEASTPEPGESTPPTAQEGAEAAPTAETEGSAAPPTTTTSPPEQPE